MQQANETVKYSTALSAVRIAALSVLVLLGAMLATGNSEGVAGAIGCAVALGGVSAFAAWRSPELDWRTPVGVYSGMTVAVVSFAGLDNATGGPDPNLLPLGVAFLWFTRA